MPPLTPLILNNALNQLDLPHLIWQDWFLDAAEVLFRLPEITQLQIALHHDVKKGICGNDLKIQILHDTHWQNENVFTPYPFEYEEILTLKKRHNRHHSPHSPRRRNTHHTTRCAIE